MAGPDLTYYESKARPGFCTFLPETKQGHDAWNKLHVHCPNGHVPFRFLSSLLQQLREAGYRVQKVKPPSGKLSKKDDDLLDELLS